MKLTEHETVRCPEKEGAFLPLSECIKCHDDRNEAVNWIEDSSGIKRFICKRRHIVTVFRYSFPNGQTGLSRPISKKHEASSPLQNVELPLWEKLNAKSDRAHGRTLLRRQALVYRLYNVHNLSITLIAQTLGLEPNRVKNYIGAVFKMLCERDYECIFKDALKVKTKRKSKQQKLFPDARALDHW